jgi:outer membrane murein-binding lipoprotein Lpp
MADFPQSSFIPKDTSGMVPGKVRRRRTFHVFGFIATAVLIGSLLLAGGVYFLKANAAKSLMTEKSTLQAQTDKYDEGKAGIAEIRDFDRRLSAAQYLLDNHISPLMIFSVLEDHTKRLVQFTSLSFEHTPGTEAILALQGLSPEFRVIALQEHEFTSTEVLSDVIFAGLAVGSEEESVGFRSIGFTLEGAVDPSEIRFGDDTSSPAVETSFKRVEETLPASSETEVAPPPAPSSSEPAPEAVSQVPPEAIQESVAGVETVTIE